jgi:hypothetical protein
MIRDVGSAMSREKRDDPVSFPSERGAAEGSFLLWLGPINDQKRIGPVCQGRPRALAISQRHIEMRCFRLGMVSPNRENRFFLSPSEQEIGIQPSPIDHRHLHSATSLGPDAVMATAR